MPRTVRAMLLLFAGSLIAGCGVGPTFVPNSVHGAALRGNVMGGQQPLTSSTIRLYAVGSRGNGSASTQLLIAPVTSGAGGAFSITGDYLCPALAPATPVYLTATGGNPGLAGSVNNTAIAMVAALGPCNAVLANAATTHLILNEATTAAAAWALAPFASALTGIGASATNSAGIANAFLTAQQLADPSTGQSPGSSIPAGAVVESAKLGTLADILSTCVNSDGTGAACSGLFADVTPPGSAAPSDTFGAALSVVKNPGYNVANLFMNHVSSSPPFPGLHVPPSDWSLTIAYAMGLRTPSQIALDSSGNIWVSSRNDYAGVYSPATLNAFTHQGVPFPQPFSGRDLFDGGGIAIDSSDNVWVGSQSNTTENNGHGTISSFNNAGVELPGSPVYSGGIAFPTGLAFDPNGNLWIVNQGSAYDPSLTLYQPITLGGSSTGAVNVLSPAPPFDHNGNLSHSAQGLAVDSRHTLTVAAGKLPTTISTVAYPSFTITQTTLANYAADEVAVDRNDNAWIAATATCTAPCPNVGYLFEVSPNGVFNPTNFAGPGFSGTNSLAIDGNNTIWVLNQGGPVTATDVLGKLSEFSGSSSASPGTPLSPSQGFGLDAQIGLGVTRNLAADGSGNLWTINYNTYGGNLAVRPTLVVFVGLAAPTATPLFGPPRIP